MATYYVEYAPNKLYTFHTNEGTSTSANPALDYNPFSSEPLGVTSVIPAGKKATSKGSFKDYPIVKVRLKLAGGTSVVRLCAARKLGEAIKDMPGTGWPDAEGNNDTIVEVIPVRGFQYRR
jgi:hypothetical protein